VPPEVDLLAVVDRAVGPPPVIGTARLWVAAGRAHGLRRLGRVLPRQRRVPDGREGDELEIDLRSLETIARWVAGYGPDVVVRYPPELAAAVRSGWAAVLAAHEDPAHEDTAHEDTSSGDTGSGDALAAGVPAAVGDR
jgi:proteasome accessory factor B